MSARILIVTSGHLCRNPRPFKEATALAQAGFAVTVLTIRNHARSLAADDALLRGAPFRCEAIDMLDLGRPAVFARRCQLWLARSVAARFAVRTLASLGPAGSLLRRARRLPADLVIVHNELPHWVGTRLLAEGRRVAADIEDWASEDLLPASRRRRPLARLRAIERALLGRAAYITTTSQALADGLHGRYGGQRPEVITNSFPLQSDPRRGPPGNPPAFFWFSQTLGPGRGLEMFLAAWRQVRRPSRLVLLGDPAGAFAQTLLADLPAPLRARVELRSLVAPSALPGLIAHHDIGLALEDASIVSRDLTITNKVLQYLNAGLALVASDTAGQREVLTRAPEAGVFADRHDSPALARTLDALLADAERLGARQQAARRLAEQVYCWEHEAPRLIRLVQQTLGGGGDLP